MPRIDELNSSLNPPDWGTQRRRQAMRYPDWQYAEPEPENLEPEEEEFDLGPQGQRDFNAAAAEQNFNLIEKPDPAAEARYRELSRRSGLPLEIVRHNADKVEADLGKPDIQELWANSQKTLEFLADPDNAALAGGSAEELARAEQAWNQLKRNREDEEDYDPGFFGTAAKNRTTEAIKTEFQSTRHHMKESRVNFSRAMRMLYGSTDPALEKEAARLKATRPPEWQDEGWGERAVTSATQFATQMGEMGLRSQLTGIVGGGVGATLSLASTAAAGVFIPAPEEVVTYPAAIKAGWSTGYGLTVSAASALQMIQLEGGAAYGEMMEMRDVNGQQVSPRLVALASIGVGLVNGALEHVGAEHVPGAKKLLGKSGMRYAMKALEDPRIRKGLKGILYKWGKGITVETLTEVAQEIVQVLAGTAVKHIEAERKGTYFEGEPGLWNVFVGAENVPRYAEVAIDTALGAALLGGVTVGPSHWYERRRARKAEQYAGDLKKVFDAVDQGELKNLNVQAAEEFLAGVTGEDDVYISKEYFQEDPDNAGRILSKLGIEENEAETDTQSGHDVKVPYARLTRLEAADFAAVTPHVKPSPGAMSMKEAERADTEENKKALGDAYQRMENEISPLRKQINRLRKEFTMFLKDPVAAGDVVNRLVLNWALNSKDDPVTAMSKISAFGGLNIPELGIYSREFRKQFAGSTIVDPGFNPQQLVEVKRGKATTYQKALPPQQTPEYAEQQGKETKYLHIVKPAVLTEEQYQKVLTGEHEATFEQLKKEGYDGAVTPRGEYVPFGDKQVLTAEILDRADKLDDPALMQGFRRDTATGKVVFDEQEAARALAEKNKGKTPGELFQGVETPVLSRGQYRHMRGTGANKTVDHAADVVAQNLGEHILDFEVDQVGSIEEARKWAKDSVYVEPVLVEEEQELRYDKMKPMYGNAKMIWPNISYPNGRDTYDYPGCGRLHWAQTNEIDWISACYDEACYAEAIARATGGSIAKGFKPVGIPAGGALRAEINQYYKKYGLRKTRAKYNWLIIKKKKPQDIRYNVEVDLANPHVQPEANAYFREHGIQATREKYPGYKIEKTGKKAEPEGGFKSMAQEKRIMAVYQQGGIKAAQEAFPELNLTEQENVVAFIRFKNRVRAKVTKYAAKHGVNKAKKKFPYFKITKSKSILSIAILDEFRRGSRVSTDLMDARGRDIRLGVDADGSAWLAREDVLDALLRANANSYCVFSSCYHPPPPKHALSGRTIIDVTVSGWHPIGETLHRLKWAEEARANGWTVILREVVADPVKFGPKTAKRYNRIHDALMKTDFFIMQQPLHRGTKMGRPQWGMPSCCQGSSANPDTCDQCLVAEGRGEKFKGYWDIVEEDRKEEQILPDLWEPGKEFMQMEMDREPPTFYSRLVTTAETKGGLPKTGDGARYKKVLNGWVKSGKISKAELEWSGVLDWLDAVDGDLSATDVMDYIRDFHVAVEENIRDRSKRDNMDLIRVAGDKFNQAAREYFDYYRLMKEEFRKTDIPVGMTRWAAMAAAGEEENVFDRAEGPPLEFKHVEMLALGKKTSPEFDWDKAIYLRERWEQTDAAYKQVRQTANENVTRWSASPNYTLPGAEKYREVTIKLAPVSSAQRRMYRDLGISWVEEAHWPAEERNVVAHVRMDERKGVNGERVLLIEEMQSDWAEEGRELGFADITAARNLKRKILKNWPQAGRAAHRWTRASLINAGVPEMYATAWETTVQKPMSGMVAPDMPFKSTPAWTGLALKRVMRFAVDEGYDRIAWVDGQTQFERYGENPGLEKFYNDVIPSMAQKTFGKKVWGSPAVEDVLIELTGPKDTMSVLSVPVTDEMKAEPTRELLQEEEKQKRPRGSVKVVDNRYIISLFKGEPGKGADLSTLLHELGHVFFMEMEDMVKTGQAADEMVADLETMRRWAGAEPGEELTRDQYENIAKAFEAYLMEGRAPSPEMNKAFYRFQQWLVHVYESVKNLLGPDLELTDEVRNVFDRMLSDKRRMDAGVVQAGLTLPTKMQLDALGVVPEDRDYIRRLHQQMKQKADAAMRAARDADLATRQKELRATAAKEVKADPVRLQATAIRKAGGIDHATLVDAYGPEVVKRLPAGIAKKKGGMLPSVAAAMPSETQPGLGPLFRNESQMIQSLAALETTGEAVERRFQQLMQEHDLEHAALQYLLDTPEYDAIQQILNKYENRAAGSNATGTPAARYQAYAVELILAKKVRDAIAFTRFMQYMKKYQRAEVKAVATEDYAAAADANEMVRLNFELARQSVQARRNGEKILKLIKTSARNKNIDPKFKMAIHRLGHRFGVIKKPLTADQEKVVGSLPNLLQNIDGEVDNSGAFSSFLVDDNTPGKYQDLTLVDFYELGNLVSYLAKIGRDKKAPRLSDGTLVKDAVNDAREAAAGVAGRKIHVRGSASETVQKAYTSYVGMGMTLPAFCREMDGFSNLGAERKKGANERLIADPVRDAVRAKFLLQKEAFDRARPHLDRIYKGVKRLSKEHGTRIFINDLPAPAAFSTIGQNGWWSPDQIFAVVHNMGNKDNIDRLKDGYKLDDDDLQKLASLLTEDELNAVQGIWDTYDSFWDRLNELHIRRKGYPMTKVEPQAVSVTAKSGKPVGLTGGYAPIKYDASLQTAGSLKVAAFTEKEELMAQQEAIYQVPSTRSGFEVVRKKNIDLPLKLTMDTVNQHLGDVVQHLSHAEAISDVQAVLFNPEYGAHAMAQIDEDAYNAAKHTLRHVAQSNAGDVDYFTKKLGWANKAIVALQLGYNFSVMAKQWFSSPGAIMDMGLKAYLHGQGKMLLPFKDYVNGTDIIFSGRWATKYKEICELSTFMAARSDSVDVDIRRLVGKLKWTHSWVEKIHETLSFSVGNKEISLRWLQENAFILIRKMDALTVTPIWHGAFKKAMQMYEGDVNQAVRYADEVVERSQPTGFSYNTTQWQTGINSKHFFRFMGYITNVYGTRRREYRRAVLKSESVDAKFYAAYFFADRILPYFLMYTVFAAFQGQPMPWDDDDEGNPNWIDFGKGLAQYVFLAGLPIVQDVLPSVGFKSTGLETPISRTVEIGQGVVSDFIDLFDPDNEERFTAFLWAVGELTSLVARVPASQVVKKGARGYEQEEDDYLADTPIKYIIPAPKK